jgi:cell division protein FtsI (penicillin-binding protein 3)
MAKLAMNNYSKDPNQFIEHLKNWRLNLPTGVDLMGETPPVIKNPKSRTWSATTLPWMAFGYEVLISPLQTLTLYNAVANNGKMMKPLLVNNIQLAGRVVKQYEPEVRIGSICTGQTLDQLKECLEGVCVEGTARNVFRNSFYKVAGKTGTALVANGRHGYADHIYQSSFVGYFPADHPKYSCIVVIRNKPFAKNFTGAAVAAPVFKNIADKMMSLETEQDKNKAGELDAIVWKKDSARYYYAGQMQDVKQVMKALQVNYSDSAGTGDWGRIYANNNQTVLKTETIHKQTMPDVKGMGLKDALYLLENMNVKVAAKGKGRVRIQSVQPGTTIIKNQIIILDLY